MPTSWLEKVTKKAGGEVGAADGDLLGESVVGDLDGEADGSLVVGELLGRRLGERLVGEKVGRTLGEMLGAAVGVRVGELLFGHRRIPSTFSRVEHFVRL